MWKYSKYSRTVFGVYVFGCSSQWLSQRSHSCRISYMNGHFSTVCQSGATFERMSNNTLLDIGGAYLWDALKLCQAWIKMWKSQSWWPCNIFIPPIHHLHDISKKCLSHHPSTNLEIPWRKVMTRISNYDSTCLHPTSRTNIKNQIIMNSISHFHLKSIINGSTPPIKNKDNTTTSWWFQPIWKTLVKMKIFPRYGWK